MQCKLQLPMIAQVVNAWTIQLKKQFLLFATGSEKLPAPRAELLRIELPFTAFDRQDHQAMLLRLPQVPEFLCSNAYLGRIFLRAHQ